MTLLTEHTGKDKDRTISVQSQYVGKDLRLQMAKSIAENAAGYSVRNIQCTR